MEENFTNNLAISPVEKQTLRGVAASDWVGVADWCVEGPGGGMGTSGGVI